MNSKTTIKEKIGKKFLAKESDKYLLNSEIYSIYYNDKVDERIVYLQSRDGEDFTGNILRIAEELSTGKYGNFKIYVYAKKEVHPKIRKLEKTYNLKIHKTIGKESEALKTLEKAKYIITDSGIRKKYVKRPEQIFLNTWHGTPLKCMGIDNASEEHRIGNIQHPFLSADYLLFPNDFVCEKMINAYMIEKIYSGKILMEGYPRNSVFFDNERREELKSEFNLKDKEIFVYMPTYKGIITNRKDEEQKDDVELYLEQLDKELNDNQILLVKLHVYNQSKLNFKKFKHIKPFIEGYEVYDILNMADVLITDYSSVFFDFANTKRKIILFNYDEEEYMEYRGIYFPLSDLPFPKVQTVEGLVKELNSEKDYDDEEFLQRFCTYDRKDAVKYICKHIFKGEKVCKEKIIEKNNKPNILIFAGALLNNGVTSSLFNMLKNMDRTKYNIFLTYRQQDRNIIKNHEDLFNSIPKDVQFLPLRSNINPTKEENEIYETFLKNKDENVKYPKSLDRLFKRELNRYFPNVKFDKVLNYGIGLNEMLLFKNMDCEKYIWVHTDMREEIKNKRNQHYGVLKEAYSNYTNVIVTDSGLIEPTSEFVEKSKIKIVHNINNYEENIKISNEEIILDKNTEIYTHNSRSIKGVLESPGMKFVAMGKFLKEKGYPRLIKVFEEFCKDYPNSQLIIIGGYGIGFEKIKNLRENSVCWKNITIIKSISNPMPILKQCDLLIIPSYYEGSAMSILEADVLNIPILAADSIGTKWIKKHGGYIAENSKEGLLKGLYDFIDGKIKPLNVDWEEYNKIALEELYSILD